LRPRWRPWRGLFRANLITYLRNPLPSSGLAIVLILFLGGIRLLQNLGVQHVNVAVVDQAAKPASAQVVADLGQYPTLTVNVTDLATAARRLASGAADIEVVIPPGLGAVDARGHLVPAQVAVSYHSGTSAESGADLVAAAVDKADRQAQAAPPVFTVDRRPVNGASGLLVLFLPSLLVFNVINAGLIFAAGIFAGYRSSGTLRRIQATGISPADMVLAHATSNVLLATVQVLAMLAVAMALFAESIPFGPMVAVAMLSYLVFLAIGLAVSGWVRDPQRATVVATSVAFPLIFIALIPNIGAGGLAGAALGALPVTLATHAMRQIVSGAAATSYAWDLAGLGAWAAIALAAAGRVFRWDE
jgi:hypothetical protein